MTLPNGEWTALKTAWRETPPAVDVAALRARLRWRALWSWTYLAIEAGVWLLLGFLAVEQWRLGESGVAAALALLAASAAAASAWARRSALPRTPPTVVGMVDLAIARARRGVRFAWANHAMSAATAVYIAVMYGTGIGAPDAAYRDPRRVLAAAAMVAAYAAGTAVYHRGVRDRERRLRALRRALTADADAAGPGDLG